MDSAAGSMVVLVLLENIQTLEVLPDDELAAVQILESDILHRAVLFPRLEAEDVIWRSRIPLVEGREVLAIDEASSRDG